MIDFLAIMGESAKDVLSSWQFILTACVLLSGYVFFEYRVCAGGTRKNSH